MLSGIIYLSQDDFYLSQDDFYLSRDDYEKIQLLSGILRTSQNKILRVLLQKSVESGRTLSQTLEEITRTASRISALSLPYPASYYEEKHRDDLPLEAQGLPDFLPADLEAAERASFHQSQPKFQSQSVTDAQLDRDVVSLIKAELDGGTTSVGDFNENLCKESSATQLIIIQYLTDKLSAEKAFKKVDHCEKIMQRLDTAKMLGSVDEAVRVILRNSQVSLTQAQRERVKKGIKETLAAMKWVILLKNELDKDKDFISFKGSLQARYPNELERQTDLLHYLNNKYSRDGFSREEMKDAIILSLDQGLCFFSLKKVLGRLLPRIPGVAGTPPGVDQMRAALMQFITQFEADIETARKAPVATGRATVNPTQRVPGPVPAPFPPGSTPRSGLPSSSSPRGGNSCVRQPSVESKGFPTSVTPTLMSSTSSSRSPSFIPPRSVSNSRPLPSYESESALMLRDPSFVPRNHPLAKLANHVDTQVTIQAKKTQFLTNLRNYLGPATVPPRTREDLLTIFAALRERNGQFGFIHGRENDNWDRFRLFFKSNRNGERETNFWHTRTYQYVVKLLKEEYLILRPLADQARSDEEHTFINYVRGNSPLHWADTSTRLAFRG